MNRTMIVAAMLLAALLIGSGADAQTSEDLVTTTPPPVAAADTGQQSVLLTTSGGQKLCWAKQGSGGVPACKIKGSSTGKCNVSEIFVTYTAPFYGTYGAIECDLDFGTYGHPFILNTNSDAPTVYLSNPLGAYGHYSDTGTGYSFLLYEQPR